MIRLLLLLLFLAGLCVIAWHAREGEESALPAASLPQVDNLPDFLRVVIGPLTQRYPVLARRMQAALISETRLYDELKFLVGLHNLLTIDRDVAVKYDPTLSADLVMELPYLAWRTEHRYFVADFRRADTRWRALPSGTRGGSDAEVGVNLDAAVAFDAQAVFHSESGGFVRALGLEFRGLDLNRPGFQVLEVVGVFKVGPDRLQLVAAKVRDLTENRDRCLVAPRPPLRELGALVEAADDLPYAVLERLIWRAECLESLAEAPRRERDRQRKLLEEDLALLESFTEPAATTDAHAALNAEFARLRTVARHEMLVGIGAMERDGDDPQRAAQAFDEAIALALPDLRAFDGLLYVRYYRSLDFSAAAETWRRRAHLRARVNPQAPTPAETLLQGYRLRQADRNQSNVFQALMRDVPRYGLLVPLPPLSAFDPRPRLVFDYRSGTMRVLNLQERLELAESARDRLIAQSVMRDLTLPGLADATDATDAPTGKAQAVAGMLASLDDCCPGITDIRELRTRWQALAGS